MTIEEVIKKYFPEATDASFERFGDGATNITYKVSIGEGDKKNEYILQKMNSSFDSLVMQDIWAVTEYLADEGFLTQRVVKTFSGELFLSDGEVWWKMLTFIPGKILSNVSSVAQAKEAGKLVGSFHKALINFKYEFQYQIPHFHDTDFIIKKLNQTLIENEVGEKYPHLKVLAGEVFDLYAELPKKVDLPTRVIHGDLKITNVIFDEKGERALALADLDTLMESTIAVELGDALRSWCMPGGEDTHEVRFDKDVYDNALSGYFSTADFLTPAEKESIPYGVKLITLELSARFITDAFNENYWVLDSSKYESLYEQNKKRAENQIAFLKEFKKYF